MNLYIPSLGDELKLTVDWSFPLHHESRNNTLFEILGLEMGRGPHWRWDETLRRSVHVPGDPPPLATIPAGEILKVDRIFIRKGASDFDSVTFLWKGRKTKSRVEESERYSWKVPAKGVRFWAKLADTRSLQFDLAEAAV